MKNGLLLICALLVIGCAPGKPSVKDPCANAPKICWGRAGGSAVDVESCLKLMSCYDWEMRAR
jgi:hypothetical protein